MIVHSNELDPPFEILEPAGWRGPVAFNSPHSGCVYPRAFLTAVRLDLAILRRSEDCFVDELLVGIVPRGNPLMRAHFPRCFVDVNREPYELDPRMFDGRLPSFANTRSMRVAGGLGTVARVVGDAQEIPIAARGAMPEVSGNAERRAAAESADGFGSGNGWARPGLYFLLTAVLLLASFAGRRAKLAYA